MSESVGSILLAAVEDLDFDSFWDWKVIAPCSLEDPMDVYVSFFAKHHRLVRKFVIRPCGTVDEIKVLPVKEPQS
jgi:hypothetical protein